MSTKNPLLPFALRLDAVVSGANGLAYLALAGPLEDLLGLDATLLRAFGAFFVAYAAAVWLVSTTLHRGAVVAVIGGNLVYAIDCLLGLGAGWIEPTTAGGAWVVVQSLIVAGFAALQYAGTRAPATAAA